MSASGREVPVLAVQQRLFEPVAYMRVEGGGGWLQRSVLRMAGHAQSYTLHY